MLYYNFEYKPKKQRMIEKEEEILQAIGVFLNKKGYPPSVREISKLVNLSSTSTTLEYLRRMQRKNQIDWTPNVPRSIKIVAR